MLLMAAKIIILSLAVVLFAARADAACPNQESQVNIPISGSTNILPEDLFCAALPVMSAATPPTPNFTVGAVKAGVLAGPTPLTASSPAGFPNVTYDATGIHLSVPVAAPGSQWSLTVTYLPANVSVQVPAYAGAQVTGLVLTD